MTKEPYHSMPPHWSDDPRFTSQQHFDEVMAGCASHKKSDAVFVGMEGGVAVYTDRQNLTGIDHAMVRDQRRREVAERAQGALLRMNKETLT